jgi:hypothetical protein
VLTPLSVSVLVVATPTPRHDVIDISLRDPSALEKWLQGVPGLVTWCSAYPNWLWTLLSPGLLTTDWMASRMPCR